MQGSLDSNNTAFSERTDTSSIQDKSFSTIFMVFFIFLALVLTIHSWHQWNDAENDYKVDMTRSVDSFVAQASITAKASIHVNQLFADIHKEELINLLKSKDSRSQFQLRQKMNKAFFNLTGYMLVDGNGKLLFIDGPLLSETEGKLVQESVVESNASNHFFAHYYGEQGGFYSISWFMHQGENYGFIVRRPYNKFSAIIYNGGFDGYQLALYDQKTNKILISEKQYHMAKDSAEADIMNFVSYRRRIAASPWELLAIEKEYHSQTMLWKIIFPSIIILSIFLIIAFILKLYLTSITKKRSQEALARRQIEQRAEKSLMSIDEAIITTNSEKIITYRNPKADIIFSRLGYHKILGLSLDDLWHDDHSLWSKDLNTEELELLQEEQRELHLTIHNEEFILEQSYNLLYDEGKVSGIVWLLRDVTDAVRNRRALEESRSRYKGIFDEAAIAHCILTIPYMQLDQGDPVRIINANHAAIDLFHAHDQQHLIHAFPQLILPQADIIACAIKSAIDNNQSSCEFKLSLNDFQNTARVFWTNISLHAGTNQNALITFIDITEQENASAELLTRERFWAKIMDQTVDMLYVLSLDENMRPSIEYCNSSINNHFGLIEPTGPEMKDWNLEFHPADHKKLYKLIEHTHHLKLTETIIETCRVRDYLGHWKIIRFTNSPLEHNSDGLVLRYISSVRDVTEEVEAQELLVENERRYRLLAENVSDVIWAIDNSLNFTFISSSIYSMLGYKPDEIYRGAVREIFTDNDLKKLGTRLMLALKNTTTSKRSNNGSIFTLDIAVMTKCGSEIIIEIQASYLHDEEDKREGIFGIVRNVTEAREIERELILAGQVFDNSTEAILVADSKGKIINANPAFFEASQFSLPEIKELNIDELINKNFHNADFYPEISRAIMTDSYWQGEVHYLRKNGEERVSWTGISATKNRLGDVQNLIVIVSDITERKVIESRIHKLAYFDPLTGLPNRSQMHERLEEMVMQARQNHSNIAVLFLDLDRFKPINDSMGHPAGDRVLKEVATRLQNCLKKQDLVSRMSGDEFTIALADQKTTNSAANTAVKVGERILHALQQPFLIEKRELFLTGSIGIAIFPGDGQTVTELLKNSDMAMYHAKDQGRNSVQFFDETMNKKAVELLEMENDLRYAIERNQLELYYQPQYASSDCRLQGVEALLRWHHNIKGMIPPNYFIPIIEDTGLIIPIGEWVLRQACSDMARWQQQGVGIDRIAINVSAKQFKQTSFIQLVRDVIKDTGINPNQLELELTESILIDDLEHTLNALSQLRAMGVRMAIDDFGTGYSSLNYLKQFPVDTLKIDQSFIRSLPGNAEDVQITRTIISMAHNLGLGVIAEGVETEEQLQFLKRVNCEELQGFFFSKPLPEQKLLEYIERELPLHL